MKTSAGILLYRRCEVPGSALPHEAPDPAHPREVPGSALPHEAPRPTPVLEVLLVHPGGPLWARRDAGAWSIPKGEHAPGDDALAAARREFREELGREVPASTLVDLGETRLRSGKVIRAWAGEGDLDPSSTVSNTFRMEWPPRSGTLREFPEIDRAAWFDIAEARRRLNPGLVPLVERLIALPNPPDGQAADGGAAPPGDPDDPASPPGADAPEARATGGQAPRAQPDGSANPPGAHPPDTQHAGRTA